MFQLIVLGIETSCDETAAAVCSGIELRSNIINTQLIHKEYGGVVPELASREHLKNIVPVVDGALADANVGFSDIEAVCVTKGPGLVGSLLIGASFAKSLAYCLDVPVIGVNHIEAHLWAPVLEYPDLQPPYVGLIISGGHTQLWYVRDFGDYTLIGQTLDDAVGEAFDKTAKMLGLDYPGGPEIDRLSREGDPEFHRFPRPHIKGGNPDFSFSGLKTSVLYYLNSLKKDQIEKHRADIAASFQQAVIDTLIKKTISAAKKHRVDKLILGGGVSANSGINKQMTGAAKENNIEVFIPPAEFCTDNAAMIAYTGYRKFVEQDYRDDLDFSPDPGLKLVN
ncbi:MAG: tRNA (adenosine(37)-N6)-threonylcarbamoyltransferase complex transferase subunit TsaD [bacterium]|nr:tRNA (adenosine(37)-N6)-threonylcarbamoyltransferase complex transferase subunit TsaD [bacterium]